MLGRGKGQGYCSALSELARDVDPAVVREYDLLNQRQTETGAGRLRREERDEHFPELVLGHACSRVCDRDPKLLPAFEQLRVDSNRTALFERVDRIDEGR